MTQMKIFRCLGGIRPAWIEEAAPCEGVRKMKKNPWVKWAAAAACLVLLTAVSVWLFVPGLEARNDAIRFIRIPLGGGVTAVYTQQTDLTHAEELLLSARRGELYSEDEVRSLYRIKGHDDTAQLLSVSEDGNTELYELWAFWNDEGVPADISIGFVLSEIYHVSSADAIRSVQFDRIDEGFVRTEKKPQADRVSVRNREDIARIYELLLSLTKSETTFLRAAGEQAHDYLTQTAPHPVQTSRKMTLKFENGTSLQLTLDLYHGILRMINSNHFAGFSDGDTAWLTELTGVNLQFTDYGIASGEEPMAGEETAEPPRAE